MNEGKYNLKQQFISHSLKTCSEFYRTPKFRLLHGMKRNFNADIISILKSKTLNTINRKKFFKSFHKSLMHRKLSYNLKYKEIQNKLHYTDRERKPKNYIENYTAKNKSNNSSFQYKYDKFFLTNYNYLYNPDKQKNDILYNKDSPKIVEQTKTQTATGSAMPKLKANKSESRLVTKTKIESSLPEMTESTTTKKRTVTTTTKTESSKPEKSVTAKAEKITETTIKKRNEGTGSTTTSRTEKTTTTGGAGSSTTTKTTTRTVSENPGNEIKTQQSSTTTTTKTTTTRRTGESGGKTETKTVTKVEESSSGETGGSSIRKKYAKGRFKH